MEIGQASNRETKRIANILIALGWQRDGKFTSGEDKGRARYIRPITRRLVKEDVDL